ncbi:hypothetical protein [Roseateles aquatilis]|jgi:hypothetical protein|uniref:hypothetical protein n=1 Tax=Roseateles aquatilis TaxID=431061 RepID=UPI001130A2C0|nr:hypothetical protein [Roseateles aquatilis]MBY0365347.1 hypothetical protein [Burkholderiaceae bacterium]
MQALLDSVESALNSDPDLAGLAIAWLALTIWGAFTVVLAYCSRLRERADMANPPQHPLFLDLKGRHEAQSKN